MKGVKGRKPVRNGVKSEQKMTSLRVHRREGNEGWQLIHAIRLLVAQLVIYSPVQLRSILSRNTPNVKVLGLIFKILIPISF